MCPSHHPSARLREEYKVGDVAPGTALAVAAHATACESCARLIREPPARAETLWRPDADGRKPLLKARLPPLLRSIQRTRWRNVARDVSVCALRGVSGLGEAVYLLRAAPGANFVLPSHADLVLGLAGRASGGSCVLDGADLIEVTSETHEMADSLKGFLALVIGDDELYRVCPT